MPRTVTSLKRGDLVFFRPRPMSKKETKILIDAMSEFNLGNHLLKVVDVRDIPLSQQKKMKSTQRIMVQKTNKGGAVVPYIVDGIAYKTWPDIWFEKFNVV